jgi:hypothetical protein
MSLVSFARRAITVIRPGRYQDHGSWYDDWDNPEAPRTITGCVIYPGVSTEDNDRQDAQKVTYTVLAPFGSDVKATDKIRVDVEPGLDLAVYGRPRPVKSPTGRLDHLQIELSDWEVT